MASFTNSSASAPKVNLQAVSRYLSSTILPNVVQNLFHRKGKGVDQRVEIQEGMPYEVRVLRQLPFQQKSRRLGAANDGEWYSSQTAEQPRSVEYMLRVNLTLDTPISIPTHTQELVPLDLVNAQTRLYEQHLRAHINASTIAAQLAEAFTYSAEAVDGGGTANYVTYQSGVDSMLAKFYDASTLLDDGDPDNGVHTFPQDGRIALWRSSGRREFYSDAKSLLDLGNFKAQELVELGTVSINATRETVDVGYFGTLDGIDNHFVAKAIWDLAEEYLVQSGAYMAAGTLDDVIGLMVHSFSTVRGIAMMEFIKTVDETKGAGYILQPAPRWGIEVFYPKGIVPIVTNTFTNPAYPASVVTPITIDATNAIA